ncbi:MAG TPA: hypothetical protein VGK99_10215 [Acidobacteriota bacterium]|jgi:hypothetical protein
MKKSAATILCVALSSLVLLGADISGKWSGSFVTTNPEGETRQDKAFLKLKQEGSEITGTAGPNEEKQWAIRNGKIDGTRITFEVQTDEPLMKFDLQVVDGRIKGEAKAEKDGRTLKATLDLGKVE